MAGNGNSLKMGVSSCLQAFQERSLVLMTVTTVTVGCREKACAFYQVVWFLASYFLTLMGTFCKHYSKIVSTIIHLRHTFVWSLKLVKLKIASEFMNQ